MRLKHKIWSAMGKDLHSVDYHIREILDINEAIERHIEKIQEAENGHDLEELATCLTYLEVEIFDHLGYHIKELRRPFTAVSDQLYKELEDKDEVDIPKHAHKIAIIRPARRCRRTYAQAHESGICSQTEKRHQHEDTK